MSYPALLPSHSRHWTVWRSFRFVFFFNDTATTEIYTLSLHDALPISQMPIATGEAERYSTRTDNSSALCAANGRSEEHTSELQSPCNLVCRLLLEKKKNTPHRLLTASISPL